MAPNMLYVHLHLIQSALGQKEEAKPAGLSRRERSQGRSAMGGHEVASLPGEVESPYGWTDKRATTLLAKFDLAASFATGRATAHAVSGGPTAPVLQAITTRTGNPRFTDEVPTCLAARRVTAGYKMASKGQSYARAAATASYRRRPRGCQQRQSNPAHRDERQYLKQPVQAPVTRKVSSGASATKWPGGTSSRQPPLRLRNVLTGAVAAHYRPGSTF
jgi:hypothetical protein